jgi:hypothetical protein
MKRSLNEFKLDELLKKIKNDMVIEKNNKEEIKLSLQKLKDIKRKKNENLEFRKILREMKKSENF